MDIGLTLSKIATIFLLNIITIHMGIKIHKEKTKFGLNLSCLTTMNRSCHEIIFML